MRGEAIIGQNLPGREIEDARRGAPNTRLPRKKAQVARKGGCARGIGKNRKQRRGARGSGIRKSAGGQIGGAGAGKTGEAQGRFGAKYSAQKL